LAPDGDKLYDLLLDGATGRLYVTDTSGQLHVLDASNYEGLAILPAAGNLTLDADNERLYVSPWDDEGEVAVVDTASLALVGAVSPGGFVTVDGERNRFYVGNQIYGAVPEGTAGVRVYDGATLDRLGEVPQPGIPVYNPLRDELYIVAYTVYTADPETQRVTGDLLPEIMAQPLAWCNGCMAATNAHVYPDRNLLVVEVTTLSAGKGPGMLPPPRFFDATTLKEVTDPGQVPPVERACEERLVLAEPVDGRVYKGDRYSRYASYNNLLVYDLAEVLETWRDGLALGITNPNTGQMYLYHGEDTLVLDLATLSPLGTLPPACVHTLDTASGRIYGLADRELVVFSEGGGWPDPSPIGVAGALPAREQIQSIQPSPDYAQDGTLFVTTAGKLYRSTDGGQTWARLRGGLPEGEWLALDLAISPDFARDRTLFAGGYRGNFWGEGVHRSTDGGDSWQPVWGDLTHLRVYDVALSRELSADDTLLAYSRYQRIKPWQGGLSLFRSTDRGLGWTLVMTSTQGTSLPPPQEFLPPDPSAPAVQFRVANSGRGVERSADGGSTWEPVVVTREPEFYVKAIVTSPTFATDRTVYVLSEFDLFRSTDGGDNWSRWRDERLAGRDYASKLTVAAGSPPLADGSHRLFVGTAAGEFWALDPAELSWEPVQVAEQWPTVLEGEWVGEIAAAPGGDVWLGTWGQGLARYSDGAIQARYSVAEGLPTDYVGALTAAPDGTVWVGGDLPPGVASFDGQTWTFHPFTEKDGVGAVHDVAVGPDGAVWVGADAQGLLHWTGQAWELVEDHEGLTGWRIWDIEIDDQGIVWSATGRGLIFNVDGAWYGEGGDESRVIEFGPGGVAYLLTSGRSVWRYDGERWTELPSPQESRLLSAATLHAAADGSVWLGTHEGAFRYDGQGWRQFTAQEGLPANDVSAIAEDAGGWLWFGTENGAGRVNPAALDLGPVVWPVPPTQTPPPGPTPTAQVTPTSTPCALPPAEPLAAVYVEAQTVDRLGCPAAEATVTHAALQPFEGGTMFWRADERAVYVLDENGTWARYPDTWDESQPSDDPALAPPDGLWQPLRGFGKVWREQLGGPQASIGWALAEERSHEMMVQHFTGGQMFLGPGGEVYVLYADTTWERRG
jgi:photosystem II stability/assembly factor-like uncharacterized protein